MLYIEYVSYVSELITIIILFLFILVVGSECLRKKTSYLKSSFYLFIFFASIGELFKITVTVILSFLNPSFIKQGIISLNIWYHAHGMGVFHVLLSLNRCTALILPLRYNQLWSIKKSCIYSSLMCLYPLVTDGISLFNGCFWIEKNTPECLDFSIAHNLQSGIGTIAFSIATFLITISCLLVNKYYLKSKTLSKVNKSFVIQAIYASILLLVIGLSAAWASVSYRQDSFNEYTFWLCVSQISHNWYHILIVMSPMIVSETFKQTFMKFYFSNDGFIYQKIYQRKASLLDKKSPALRRSTVATVTTF